MDGESEVDLSNNNISPIWRISTTLPGSGERTNLTRRPRPLSYTSPNGVLVTDFPVEDTGTFTVTQPAEKIVTTPEKKLHQKNNSSYLRLSLDSLPNGNVHSPPKEVTCQRQLLKKSPQASRAVSRNCESMTPNGKEFFPYDQKVFQKKNSKQSPVPAEKEQIIFGSAHGLSPTAVMDSPANHTRIASRSCQTPDVDDTSPSSSVVPTEADYDSKPHFQRQISAPYHATEKHSVVLSTHSQAALKVGTQQIIPKGLASETKGTNKNKSQNSLNLDASKRIVKSHSMVETSSSHLLFHGNDGDIDIDMDSLGTFERGLRSTSYRRAVVSGIDFDSSSNNKTQNRISQPNLHEVVENKDKFYSLGNKKKKKKKPPKIIHAFEAEENAVLYQNYKEKALDNDSEEETEIKGQKSENRIIVHHKPLRAMWSQLSLVKRNGVSQKLSLEERKRQEAIYEVISSEQSYLRSLEILIRMFKNSKELSNTMTKTEKHHLFSNISDVYEASKKFFKELEACHQQNIVIDDISDIMERHTMSTFDPYVKYCTNEVYQQRTLQKLLHENPAFKEALSKIESEPECRNLPMISFLILPMQRVTRLPLLMDTICQKTPKDSPQYESCTKALKAVGKLVRQCNDGARRMERTEMMYTINSQLEFKIKPFPLVSSSRWLIKRGELTAFVEETGIFKRTTKSQVYLFLFNDVLIITKKKSEESYTVTDYALGDQLSVEPCDMEEQSVSPVKTTSGMLYSRQSSACYVFKLTIHSNRAGERVEMLLGAESLSDRARWISALERSSSDKLITDRKTLLQVEIIRSYTAKQPDELTLQLADVVLVYQKVNSDWYEGERLRDAERGWFPADCAREITCQMTMDKNMERMGRLLALETNV